MLAHDDIRTLTADVLLAGCGRLPSVIVGSPPCQDASVANTSGLGVDGARTGLFFEAIRLVGECRPAWACFENVPGLRTRGSDRVLSALEALGYACWPIVVGAVHAGAPHRRNRVWIIAADLSSDGRRQGLAGRLDPGDQGEREQTLSQLSSADADRSGLWQQPWRGSGANGFGKAQPAPDAHTNGKGQHGVEHTTDTSGGRPRPGSDIAQSEPAMRSGDADGARLALGEGEREDTCAELPPAIRAIAEGGDWNGRADGLARSMRVADGLSAGLARQCISAYGDGVVPQITEAIGRVMMRLVPTDGTVLDLFSGAAGGWSFGLHRAGYRTIAFCEIDPWRRAVFAEGYIRARK